MLPHAPDSDLAQFMEQVSRALLGNPNPHLSSKTELRFGSNGSMKVDLAKGTAYSHEEQVGGGVLWLIEREKKLTGSDAFAFLREIGCDLPEPAKSNGHAKADPAPLGKEVASYDYVDEAGALLFQVVRFEPKTFRQRQPDPSESSGWSFKVRGVRQVPYRLTDLIDAIAQDRPVVIVEGEKDADNLNQWMIQATCNAGGAGKWPDGLSEFFRNADIIIVPDNDPQAKNTDGTLRFYPASHPDFPSQPAHPGQDHAELVARKLSGIARRIRVLMLPDLPAKGDVSDFIAAGNTPERFWQLAEAAGDWRRRPELFVSRFGGLRWEMIGIAGAGVGYTWLVEDIVPMGEITLVYGDSGTGKSFGIFDMSMAVARGLPFAAKNVEPGLVVYVAAEAGKGFTKRKLAYAQHHSLDDMALPFYLCTKRPDFFTSDDDVDALIVEITAISRSYQCPLVMIVLDTLSALAPGMNENASADVSRVRARLVRLNERFNVATILVHHKPKGGSTPRGHGSLTADFETTIEFETLTDRKTRHGPLHRATVRKQREGKSGVWWEFTLPVVTVGKNKWGNDETCCVVAAFTEQRATAAGGFHASKGERLFLQSLFDAVNDHGVLPPSGLPDSITRAVDIAYVRAVMRSKMITGEDDATKADNRFRAAFKRAGDALQAGAVIGYRKPLAWYTGRPVNGFTQTMTPVDVEAVT